VVKEKLKRKYTPPVLKLLFGLSGNQCAHPDCLHNIIESKTEYSDAAVVGQICHIYAISEDGPRGKPGLTEEVLNSIDNLILCCGHHHPVIDKQYESYPAKLLNQWKEAHEAKINRIVSAGSKPIHTDVFSHQVFREDLVDGEIKKQVDRLRKSRFFPEFEKIAISRSFGRELVDRSLSGGTDEVRCNALAWCARILSVSDEIETAKEYLDAAKLLGVCREIDIAEAFICSKVEGKNAGLKILGKYNTPETRSASFMIVATHEKLESALAWLKFADINPSDLDADGKFNLLSHLLTEGEWVLARELADNSITFEDFEKTPALYRYVAMTYLVHAIPEDFRMLVLGQIPFGARDFPLDDNENGIDLRNRSIALFRAAGTIERQLNCPRVASFDEDFVLWLELRDHNKREEAKARLEKAFENVATGLRLVALAFDFGIKLDEKVIDREIERQFALNGEYTFESAIARFSLAFIQESERHVVDYLEKYEANLIGFIENKAILRLKAEMLARSRQYEKARLCLEKLKSEGASQAELNRVQRLIEEAEGGDTFESIVAQFNFSGDIQDLIVLVKEVEAGSNLSELVHYSELLFEKTQSFPDAVRLAQAYYDDHEFAKVTAFLSSNPTYLDRSGDLRLLLAFSYFDLGQLSEATSELNKLPADYENPNVGSLRIDISISSGDWNSLTVTLAKNYERRDQKSAVELIRLANIAFQVSSPYAKDFLFLAVEKGSEDPQILTNAYGLATQAGIEDSERIAGWFKEAAALSGDNGPIQMMSLDEMLEVKPLWDERSDEIWGKLADGRVPMFMAGEYLNKSLVELMLFPAITNMSEPDPRRRGAIPAYSGKRSSKGMPNVKVIGLDATALLTLGFLNILEKAIENFDQVFIPHSTLRWLFQENSKASFHQPSRIKNSHHIRNLVSTGALEKHEPHVATNSDLSAMVGEELAQLLSEANARKDQDSRQKIVVRSSPVHHIGSLGKIEADTSKYSDLLSSCQALVDKLAQLGQISGEEQLAAKCYLELHELPWPNQPEIFDRAVLYLDGLAVTYLLHLGILEKLAPSGFKVVISAREVEDGNNLISFEHASGKVKDVIEYVRSVLSNGLENGRIRLGKRMPAEGERILSNQEHPSIEAISLADYCEGVVLDDRFLNRHQNIEGGEKTAKVITTLELLRDLCFRKNLPVKEFQKCKTQLRQACYFFIPLDEDELIIHIKGSNVRDGKVIETPDLRAIRENLLRVRMSDWLSLPDEGPWIENIFKDFNITLKHIWEDESELETILARSDWLLGLFDLRGWAHRLIGEAGDEVGNAARLPYILMIVSVSPEVSSGMREEFWNWVESRLILPIKEEYPELYNLVVRSQVKYFDHLKEIGIDDAPR
jgi:tetratricopeptide (TPR) repeat protein